MFIQLSLSKARDQGNPFPMTYMVALVDLPPTDS